jgi:TolB protein
LFNIEDADSLLPGPIINISKSWSKYINSTYNLSLMYPPLWTKIDDLHYAGIDGYFRISVLKTDMTMDDICKKEAHHKLQPYGSNPDIVSDTAAGLDVCLVMPSGDQPADMKKQAALIIKYPEGLVNSSQAFNIIILYTDLQHLNDIKNSLTIESKRST